MPPKKLPSPAPKATTVQSDELVYTLEFTLPIDDALNSDVRETVREAIELLRQIGGCEIVKVSPETIQIKPPDFDI